MKHLKQQIPGKKQFTKITKKENVSNSVFIKQSNLVSKTVPQRNLRPRKLPL